MCQSERHRYEGVQRDAIPWLWVSNRGEKHSCWHTILLAKLDAMLSDVKLTNYKVRAAQIADFLEKYIPDVAAMETQMKKYEKYFTTVESEKKALKKKNADLLANLIEKYAAVLDIDNLPEVKPTGDGTGNVTVNDSDKNFTDSSIDSEKIE